MILLAIITALYINAYPLMFYITKSSISNFNYFDLCVNLKCQTKLINLENTVITIMESYGKLECNSN